MSEYLFSHGGHIECPECPGQGKRNKKPLLICSETSYSGCSVDIGHCEECGKCFEVSFQVRGLKRVPEWDGHDRKERLAEEIKDAKALSSRLRDQARELLCNAEKSAIRASCMEKELNELS